MRNTVSLILLMTALLLPQGLLASPGGQHIKVQEPAPVLMPAATERWARGYLLAENLVPDKRVRTDRLPPEARRLEPQASRLSDRQAASQVKQRYGKHKILSINLIESNGPAVYRVKTLSPDGVVKYVFVDGNSGAVFD